jgi:hypothetical protein
MRLFLVPISTRRAFVYCRPSQTALKTGYLDRITNKAAETWSNFEAAETGWKKKLVTYGQVVLQRIPYEEWGLKSIPPLNAQRQIEEESLEAKQKPVDVMFPGNAIKQDSVLSVLRTLGTERQDLHRRKMWWCLGIAPLTAPVAILPVYAYLFFLHFENYFSDLFLLEEFRIFPFSTLPTEAGHTGEVSGYLFSYIIFI